MLSGFVYDRRKHPHERTQTKQGHCWHEKNLRVANTESFGCCGCSRNMKRLKRLLAIHSSLVGETVLIVATALSCPAHSVLFANCQARAQPPHPERLFKVLYCCTQQELGFRSLANSSQVSQSCVQMRTIEFLSLLLLLLLLLSLLLLLFPA